MILNEIDAISSRAEIIPQLQQILDSLQSNVIDKNNDKTQLEQILQDITVRVKLTTPTKADALEWQFLVLTVQNIINGLEDL